MNEKNRIESEDAEDAEGRELTRRLKANEPGAFKQLVELYQDRVFATCYRFLLNRQDIEDIAQEVFIEIYRSISTFKEQSKLSTWIYRIAVTKSLDLIRKTKRKKRFAPVKSLFGLQEEGKDIPDPKSNDPQRNLEQTEGLRILKEAIDTLPENQRIAFTLSKCEGFGNKEITEIMGCSLSSVESLMHRAKKNLRKKLYHYFERDLKKKQTLMLLLIFLLLFQLTKHVAHAKWARGKIKNKTQVLSLYTASTNG
ncbi:MAG: RNA polymerase sigma factor, partial [bacterium]|nr:RNA polymerase sigma factor [bacterium]